MFKKYLKKISLFMSSILILGTFSSGIASAYEESSRNEIIEITKDTDYSALNRAEWKDIDWSKYGGGGIENTDLQSYLNSIGINPIKDENYGATLANYRQEKVTMLNEKVASEKAIGDWIVGDTIQGMCSIQKSWMDGMGQSYFELGNFRDGLGGLEQVGLGWCMDNTAAEPPAGHTIVGVTATATSIDSVNGWINFNVVVTPKDVTTGIVGGNGLLQGYQHVGASARMKVDVKGQLQISKKSSDPTIADGNNCYSLAGAEYTIYSEPNAVHAIAKVTMDSMGWSVPVSLNAGLYYIMETKAPKGYALDNKVYQVEVLAGQTTSRTFADIPQTDPVGLMIKKVDADTGEKLPQGNGSLADAEFTIKFFDNEYAEDVNPEDLGVTPSRTWIMRTDEDGFTYLDENYKVGGDDLYYVSGNPDPTIPLGTITMQETKAPLGYKINPEIFVRKITPTGSGNLVNTFQEATIKEEVIKGQVKVIKVDEETGERLQGAEFELVDRLSGTVVETLITGADGSATSGLHPFDEYILRETKAPHKYTLNGKEHFVTISEDMQVVEVTHENRIIKGFVEIQKSDSEIDGLNIEGAVFGIFNEAGNKVEELITDKNGYVKSNILNWGNYTIRELKPAPGYQPTNTEWKVEIREDNKVYSYDIKNDIVKGKVQIVKIDSSNVEKPVAGATFDIVAQNVFGIAAETVVDTITTDENGFAFTKDLRFGDYYLLETNVGPDYWLNTTKYPVSITEHGKIVVKHIKNDPVLMRLRVLKFDEDSNTKEPIRNTKFKVVNKASGEDIEFTYLMGIIPIKKTVFTTSSEGEILFPRDLPHGDYQLVEVEPAEGYNPIAPIDFTIDRNTSFEEIELLGKVHTIEVGNTRINGEISIVKVDKDSREPLQGVEFEIKCISGFDKDKTWTETTDDNGKILKEALYGTYEIREVIPLWNYVTNGEVYTVEINKEGQVIELEIENEKIKGEVELIKKDAETGRVLEVVEFELYNGNTLVGTYKTDKDGRIKVTGLEAGNYYFKEISNDGNYIISDEQIYFEIKEHKQVIELEALNKVKEGEVDFSKTDVSTGALIEGATIEIKGTEEQNKHINIEFVSTKEETRFKLPVGKYEFKETIAPEGYVINEEIGYFEIKENEVVKAELKNKRIVGTLDFSKTDVSNGELIEGAHIKIECIEGFNKGQAIEFISSQEGNRFELEYGKYKFYETMAPEGYELSTEVGEFEITEDGKVVKAELKNKRIPEQLPQTGGKAGSLVVIPGLIILILGVLLFMKKRTNK